MKTTSLIGNNIYFIDKVNDGNWCFKYNMSEEYKSIIDFPIKITCIPNKDTLTNIFFISDLCVSSKNHYFDFCTNNIKVYGNNKVIKTKKFKQNFEKAQGLFKNGDAFCYGKNNICIENLSFENTDKILFENEHGHILQPYFGNNSRGNIIKNVVNTSDICNEYGGGICGAYVGNNSNEFRVIDCRNFGNLCNHFCGGIFASASMTNARNFSLINNHNSGEICGNDCGGLCGSFFGRFVSGNILIEKNSNQGHILGKDSGGLFGKCCFGEMMSNKCVIKKCFNTGEIKGFYSGGILSRNCFNLLKCGCCVFIETVCNTGKLCPESNYISGILGLYNFMNCSEKVTLKIKNSFNSESTWNYMQYMIIGKSNHPRENVEFENIYAVINNKEIANFSEIEYINFVGKGTIFFDSEWNHENAYNILLNVANKNNLYNNFSFMSSDWIEISNKKPYIIPLIMKKTTFDILPSIKCISLKKEENENINSIQLLFDSVEKMQNKNLAYVEKDNNININKDKSAEHGVNLLVNVTKKIYNMIYEEINDITLNIQGVGVHGSSVVYCKRKGKIKKRKIKEISEGDIVQIQNKDCIDFISVKYIFKMKIVHKKMSTHTRDILYVLRKEYFDNMKYDLILCGGQCVLVNDYPNEDLQKKHEQIFEGKNKLNEKFKICTYLHPNAQFFSEEGIYDLYNLVLENYGNISTRYMLYVNNILIESMSENCYNKYRVKE
jgi:hypothetical protein